MAVEVAGRGSWDIPQGRTQGTVVDRRAAVPTPDGNQLHACDDPRLVVEPDRSAKQAARVESALRLLGG